MASADVIVPDSEAAALQSSSLAYMGNAAAAADLPSSPPPAPVHVAPKRTYGRARALGPTIPVVTQPTEALSPDDIVLSSTQENTIRSPSPAEARSAVGTPAWKRFARTHEEAPLDEDDEADDEVNEEEIDRAMMLMRHGEVDLPLAAADNEQHPPTRPLPSALVGTSSLTDLPSSYSSPLPILTSSPSRPNALSKQDSSDAMPSQQQEAASSQSPSMDEETAPVRRAGTAHRSTATGKRRAVVSEDEEGDDERQAGPSSPRVDASMSRDEGSTPIPTGRRRRQRASSEDEAIPDISPADPHSPTPAARARSPEISPGNNGGDFTGSGGTKRKALQELAKSRRAELDAEVDDLQEDAATPMPRPVRPWRQSDDLGADNSDEDYDVRTSGKGKNAKQFKIKGLSKKERLEMEKLQAQIKAGKGHQLGLLVKTQTPDLADFARKAAIKVSQAKPMQVLSTLQQTIPPVPALTRDNAADVSSDMEATPNDEIVAFSSIRSAKVDAEGDQHRLHSSPVPYRKSNKDRANVLTLRPVSSKPLMAKTSKRVIIDDDDGEDDILPDVEAMFDPAAPRIVSVQEKKEQLRLQKQRKLELESRIKPDPSAKTRPVVDDDLDIEMPGVAQKPLVTQAKKPRLGGTASAVNYFKPDKSGDSKRRLMQIAGRAGGVDGTATDSMQRHAGQEFGHGANRIQNGPYRPPGIAANKLDQISAEQRDRYLLAASKRLAAEEARRKEEESGIKAKKLAERTAITLPEGKPTQADDFATHDSDDKDGEHDPSAGDRRADQEDSGDEDHASLPDEDIEIELSGSSEDEGAATAEEDEEDLPIAGDSDKENVAPPKDAQAGATNFARLPSKAATHKRTRIVDSDDEDEILAPIHEASPQPAAASAVPASLELDLDGGFSQFFEATQGVGVQGGSPAGFGELRHEAPPTLLQGNGLLPSIDLSATALERDAALLQAELEVAAPLPEVARTAAQPAKQYVNEKGFFTQTKPAAPDPLNGEDSFIQESLPMTSGPDPESLLSATYRSLQPSTSSPEGARPRRKLKARSITPEADEGSQQVTGEVLDPTQLDMPSAEKANKQPANAFTALMASKGEAAPAAARARSPINMRDFVEDQADESDEEDAFGIAGRRDDDDDEDEDMDQPVEGLVDDQERTLEEQAQDKEAALVKLREIEAMDDKARQDLATKVTEGKFRGRRRDGTMGDLDLSDEDEEGHGRKRKRQRRRQRELGHEDALAELPEDNAFRKTYEMAIASDDEDETTAPIVWEDEPVARSPSPQVRQEVSRSEVEEQLRAMAKKNRENQRRAREAAQKASPMVDLDSDDDDEPVSSNGFRIVRERPALKPSRPSADKDKRLQALLENETPSDSRRAGGNSSVSQLKNAPAAAKVGSTFRGGSAVQGKAGRALPKKQSSMSSAVMVKTRGFE